ncbi:MAG: hypothetical protein EA385_14980 [Salinarimonadaceae bacterium]|nr:MAG: hypothetical protein EA385_14980 [Salinarimonadaceae bacterium]
MARTLIGNLILRLQDNVSAGARTAVNSLRDVERAAREIGRSTGDVDRVGRSVDELGRRFRAMANAPWGTNFQRQIDRLKLSRDEMRAVGRSWDDLQRRIRDNSMNKSLRNSNIAAWKNGVLGHFADVRAGIRQTERQHQRLMQSFNRRVVSPVATAMGLGTGAYVMGRVGRAGFRAAGERGRREYQYKLANIPESYGQQVAEEAARLAYKYGAVDQSEILELGRVSYTLFGGREDHAISMLEPIVRNMIATMTEQGVGPAADRVRQFLRAMDQANQNELLSGMGPKAIAGIMEGAVRAAQVEGKEIAIEDYLAFSQTANVARYGLSEEFWASTLPALMQDQGAGRMGQILAGAYRNLVTPIGSGPQARYLQRQQAIGLRDENQTLLERDLFVSDPYRWANEVLAPLLEKHGTDLSNQGDVAEAVGRLMSHRLAAGGMTAMIIAEANIDKNIEQYRAALGSADAQNARNEDPFIAFGTLMASLRDLSGELGQHVFPVIIPGLNGLADGVRRFAEGIKGADGLGSLTLGAAVIGGGAWASARILGAVWGLITAGAALKGSAAALTAAAAALGGQGVVGKAGAAAAGAGAAGAGTAGILSRLFRIGAGVGAGVGALVTMAGDTPGSTYEEQVAHQRAMGEKNREQGAAIAQWLRDVIAKSVETDTSPRGMLRWLFSDAQQDADTLRETINTPNRLTVDNGDLQESVSLVERLISGLQTAQGLARSTRSGVDADLSSAFSDYGVSP